MKIVRIFGGELWSVAWSGETKDEFSQAFTQWQDVEYLESFFERHREDLLHGFYRYASVEDAVWETIQEARQLEHKLLQLCKNAAAGKLPNLDGFFVPLHNHEIHDVGLSKRKGKGLRKRTWLRIYAIKIDLSCYLIVGSAIKLTHRMDEREHTASQLRRLEQARNYLKSQGIEDIEGFMEFML